MYEVYKIKNGDTIDDIALKFSTTPSELYDLNIFRQDINLDDIDSIVVPSNRGRNFEYYTVEDNDSIEIVANKYNTTPRIISSLNGLKDNEYIYVGETLLVPKQTTKLYLTKEGDTLNDIFDKFGLSIEEMNSMNKNIYLLPDQLITYKN